MQDVDRQTSRGFDGHGPGFGAAVARSPEPQLPWLTIDRSRERLESRLRGALIAAVVVGVATGVLQLAGVGHGATTTPPAPRPEVAGQQGTVQGEQAPPSDEVGTIVGAADSSAPAPTAAAGTATMGGATVRAGATTVPSGSPPAGSTPATAAGAFGTVAGTSGTPRAGVAAQSSATPRAGSSVQPNASPRASTTPTTFGSGQLTAQPSASPRAATTPASSGQLAVPLGTPVATVFSRAGSTPASILTPVAGTPGPLGQRSHVVQSGDTLFAIANGNNTTVEAIVTANNLRTSDVILNIGQRLVLP
jgi:LysM repeat protein